MFWTDKLVGEIKEKYTEKIKAGKPLVIRDEKTMSGRVHVGSLRGVAIHGIISEILNKQEIANTYLFEINDFDLMDGLPVYLDQGKYLPYMGYLLCDIPAPNGKAKNYAEYFAEEFLGVIKQVGFNPEYYRSSELYRAGKYNKVIKIALENASKIRAIYKKVSGAEKEDDWFPLQVKCEKCGKVATTKVISYGEEEVEYVCKEDLVKWTKGCSYRGKISPFDGNAKLPWKVEWAAKFKVLGVDIEGAGKDHSTRGGSREIAETISREVFGHIPPFNIPYEFFQVGGKKMSSSRGAGSSSKEISNLLPPEILRLLLLGKNPNKVIDFIPDGDTIPILYDLYDKMAAEYFAKKEGDYQRIFSLIHASEKIKERFLPRFSQIAFLVQMPHMEIEEEVKETTGKKIIGINEEVEIIGKQGLRHKVMAKIDTGAFRTTICQSMAEQFGVGKNVGYKKVRSALGTEKREIIEFSFILDQYPVNTQAFVADREELKYDMIIGRRDLKRFLVDPDKKVFMTQETKYKHELKTLKKSLKKKLKLRKKLI